MDRRHAPRSEGWVREVKTVNVPATYSIDIRIEVDEDNDALRIIVCGASTPFIHRSDAEELLKALFETLLVPFNVEDTFDHEACRRVGIKRYLRRLGVLEQHLPSTLKKQEETL